MIPQITPLELKSRLDKGDDVYLLDVREPRERDICNIGGELVIIGMLNVFLAVASVSTNPGQMTCNLILFWRHIKYRDSANDMLADLVGP